MFRAPERPTSAWALACWLSGACGGPPCGPSGGEVARAVDGDTVVLAGGERVRYLLVDTPEIAPDPQCFAAEARELNRALVEHRQVELAYDLECRDRFDRLLAWVSVNEREVNRLLVARGFARVMHVPPNGAGPLEDFLRLEGEAKAAGRGRWGACPP